MGTTRQNRMINADEVRPGDKVKLSKYGNREVDKVEQLGENDGQRRTRVLFKRYGSESKPLTLTFNPRKGLELGDKVGPPPVIPPEQEVVINRRALNEMADREHAAKQANRPAAKPAQRQQQPFQSKPQPVKAAQKGPPQKPAR